MIPIKRPIRTMRFELPFSGGGGGLAEPRQPPMPHISENPFFNDVRGRLSTLGVTNIRTRDDGTLAVELPDPTVISSLPRVLKGSGASFQRLTNLPEGSNEWVILRKTTASA